MDETAYAISKLSISQISSSDAGHEDNLISPSTCPSSATHHDGQDVDPELGPCPYASKPVTSSERVSADGNLMKRSKRTDRLRKRQEKLATKKAAKRTQGLGLFDLPGELLLNVLAFLRPSQLYTLLQTCHALRDFILQDESTLSREIIRRHYSVLARCLQPPVLLDTIDDVAVRKALQHPERISSNGYRMFQHVPTPNPEILCTCFTCISRWNALALTLDFAHWRRNLDAGEPIPLIPRGTNPAWNTDLLAAHEATLLRAVRSPLMYARVLEQHLASTTGAIRRHGENKGNRRRRFRLTAEDEATGTDAFLERSGPPTVDFPFHRDNYYMLEAYLPNRGWSSTEQRWMYLPDWHARDLEWITTRWGDAQSSEGR
ncbi:hypothetical protein F5X68DRAFT_161781 [Plectosphaerella plurivora]|uniref:F-box domain-containing protein n=1 Tax=Plectosphaerella plurivora TaxID=936078 RepID=A0A9P9A5V6_9PEZI|nr:hypothetical protein F5X68DRAFT_161781 [Plectosphaerella plurivora]